MTVATIATIEVPLGTLEACPEIVEICLEIGEIGLQASLSDAGTGAAMARAAASGAYQNVCINLPGLADRPAAATLLARADAAWTQTESSPRAPRRSSSRGCGRPQEERPRSGRRRPLEIQRVVDGVGEALHSVN